MTIITLPSSQPATDVYILDSNKVNLTQILSQAPPILQGIRSSPGLWKVPSLSSTNTNQPNALFLWTTAKDIQNTQFLHTAAGYPVPSTLIWAIQNNHFVTWPNFTVKHIQKNLPKSIPTIKGHFDQTRKRIHKKHSPSDDTAPPGIAQPTSYIYAMISDVSPQQTIYTDLTGRFPVPLSQGNKYIFVFMIMTAMPSLLNLYPTEPVATFSVPIKRCSNAYNKLDANLNYSVLITKLLKHSRTTSNKKTLIISSHQPINIDAMQLNAPYARLRIIFLPS